MQILKSGSFINLENQEKIEQLIFTAKEIAETAAETEGFTNQEESNKRFALEIWQGAEYMCRDFEEIRIKDIFVSNFLERLREIVSASEALNRLPDASAGDTKAVLTEKADGSKDEFPEFEETANTNGQGSAERDLSGDELEKENRGGGIAEPEEKPDLTIQNGIPVDETTEPFEFSETETVESGNAETEVEKACEPSQTDENENVALVSEEDNQKSTIGAPENEPYQFDKCTVTATIQLLPAGTEKRRVVLSVRTHDFAPQISVVELAVEASPENLLRALEKSFEKYKNDLPVKVMDKMKKERAAVKKQPAKILPNSKPGGEVPETAVPAAGSLENGSQASLFGF